MDLTAFIRSLGSCLTAFAGVVGDIAACTSAVQSAGVSG